MSREDDHSDDLLEAAADQTVRLHLLVHPGPERRDAAAEQLARLISRHPATRLRAEKSRWTISDSRRCIEEMRRDGGPIICDVENAGRRDLDPLLTALEQDGGRTLILTMSSTPADVLKGRGSLTLLPQQPAGRRKSAKPDEQQLRNALDGMRSGDGRTGSLLRQQPDSPWGARMADSILHSRRHSDLPPELQLELLLSGLRPQQRPHSSNEAR